MTQMTAKSNILLVGAGAVGTIGALNIETGGFGSVTAVLRSNYEAVIESGFRIDSIDHGHLTGWRPTKVVNSVPDVVKENLTPFDYVVCCTKNCPDIPPSLSSLIEPAVTPGHTVIVLVQNGLNIEKPLFAAFPSNIVLSGISMIDAYEREKGWIMHEFEDQLVIGAWNNPNFDEKGKETELEKAKEFMKIYRGGEGEGVERPKGRPDVRLCKSHEEVQWYRWRKLVFNSALNPICAVTGLDDARIRHADGAADGLVRPAMREIVATAAKLGYVLPEDIVETMINMDPIDLYLKPSMLVDAEKGNFLEFENLIGEPLREAERAGVDTPTLRVIYYMCKALQWKTKEARGLVTVPPKRHI
ncbi:2-dehydropantoate 2-reductase family protein [Xylogone sp. PMI_703]|nr:2-dehydropantoate 2-reductase family protein [Xylogone sp. PMI_703]